MYQIEGLDCVYEPVNSVGGLYISDALSAFSEVELKKHKITSVVSVLQPEYVKKEVFQTLGLKHKIFNADDCYDFSLEKIFCETSDLIDKDRLDGNVLVHCAAGVSRSATIVISYLMKDKKMTYKEAYDLLLSKRPQISPNSGFIAQLKNYESKILK